jgi:hypothetical protein
MRKIAKLMVAVFALSGCAHKSLFQEKTDEFVGHPLSAVAAKLGAPTEESEVGDVKFTSGLVPTALKESAQSGRRCG